MKQPIVVIGLGEIGSVFARGLLKLGHSVIPVTRDMSLDIAATEMSAPLFVVVAVAENDLHPVLEQIPQQWQDRIVLLQNELLPRDWQKYSWTKSNPPTVISVWFEKKKGQDSKVLIPSPIYGSHAQVIHDALATLDIPVDVLKSEEQLALELVIKNVFILTTNISGLILEAGTTVDTLWQQHQDLATAVANDVIDIQEYLTGLNFNRAQLIDGIVKAFNGDLEHKCMGRSAPDRLKRALTLAKEANLKPTQLNKISNR